MGGGPQEIALCKEVLFSPDCGALCDLQASPHMLLEGASHQLLAASLCATLSPLTDSCVEPVAHDIQVEVLHATDRRQSAQVCHPGSHDTYASVVSHLQVYDMLCAAGLSQHDPVLATLFRVERVCGPAMDHFYQVVDLDPVHGASCELLAGIAARHRWENRPLGYRQQSTSLRQEKAMMGQLRITGTTEFRRFPDDSAQLGIPALVVQGQAPSHHELLCVRMMMTQHVTKHCAIFYNGDQYHVTEQALDPYVD